MLDLLVESRTIPSEHDDYIIPLLIGWYAKLIINTEFLRLCFDGSYSGTNHRKFSP